MTKVFYFVATLAFALAPQPSLAQSPTSPVGRVRLPILSYTINESGPADGAHPKRSDTITVDYELRLIDGKVVDGSKPREPATFTLDQLIPAWQVLLPLMRPGDNWTFYVPPEYAYGSATSHILPANSFLVFKVKLVSFTAQPQSGQRYADDVPLTTRFPGSRNCAWPLTLSCMALFDLMQPPPVSARYPDRQYGVMR